MFRTAVLRTTAAAAAAARRTAVPAARSFSAISRPSLVGAVKKQQTIPAAWKIGAAVRTYASGGGLTKDEAEGRIMNLLAGFDKVSSCTRSRVLVLALGVSIISWERKKGSTRCFSGWGNGETSEGETGVHRADAELHRGGGLLGMQHAGVSWRDAE